MTVSEILSRFGSNPEFQHDSDASLPVTQFFRNLETMANFHRSFDKAKVPLTELARRITSPIKGVYQEIPPPKPIQKEPSPSERTVIQQEVDQPSDETSAAPLNPPLDSSWVDLGDGPETPPEEDWDLV